MRPMLLLAAAFQAMPALVLAPVAFPAVAQEGAGDEARVEAHRTCLAKRLAVAERLGTTSRREAARYRRALDAMIRSARADLRRPPHLITAAENATYRRTIADVEAALARRSRTVNVCDLARESAGGTPAERCRTTDASLRTPSSPECRALRPRR